MPVEDAFAPESEYHRNLARDEQGREWLAALPAVVAEYESRWELTTGRPYTGGSAAWVAPATRADGSPAVLRVGWPHREAREEAAGLRFWDGDGAVRLYDADPERYVVLVERCDPGTHLSHSTLTIEERLAAAAAVARRLWSRPAPPPRESTFETVADVSAEWAIGVRERMERYQPPLDPGLVGLGADLLEWLPATATRDVVIHGDFNPGNVLDAHESRLGGDQPWLAIDVKPMTGDPAYDPSPLLFQVDRDVLGRVEAQNLDPASERHLRGYFHRFAEATELPFDRLVAWALARSIESALWHVHRDGGAGAGDDAGVNLWQAELLSRWVDFG